MVKWRRLVKFFTARSLHNRASHSPYESSPLALVSLCGHGAEMQQAAGVLRHFTSTAKGTQRDLVGCRPAAVHGLFTGIPVFVKYKCLLSPPLRPQLHIGIPDALPANADIKQLHYSLHPPVTQKASMAIGHNGILTCQDTILRPRAPRRSDNAAAEKGYTFG